MPKRKASARRQPPGERPWLAIPRDPPLPRQWRECVNEPQTEAEVNAVRTCIRKGLPFGDDQWVKSSVVRLDLESTLRPRGRPRIELPAFPPLFALSGFFAAITPVWIHTIVPCQNSELGLESSL